jgi:hypothetical protein
MGGRVARSALVVHPFWRRVATTMSVAVGLAIVPPFAALYWLTAATGKWPAVLAVQAVTMLAITAAAIRVRHVVIKIDSRGIRERGYFGRLVVTPPEEIDSVLILSVLAGSSAETTTQLFVLDRHGRTRLRMRGQYWSEDALRDVEHALDVPVQRLPAPLTRRELRVLHGRNLLGYERHPALAFTAVALAAAAVAVPVFVEIESLL